MRCRRQKSSSSFVLLHFEGMCATDKVEAINKTDVAASQGLELHDSKDDETTPLAGTLPATPLPDHQAAHSSSRHKGGVR